jgi:small subunit ribosomal protein S8
MLTDPVADMLTRIRNASAVNKEIVEIPSSRLKFGIAKILVKEGFIDNVSEQKIDKVKRVLKINLKYNDTQNAIKGIERASKPGRRVYAPSNKLPKVMGGLGIAILSTSSGLLTDIQAQKQGVGGEVLAYVW